MDIKFMLVASTPPTALVLSGAFGRFIGDILSSLGLNNGVTSSSNELITAGVLLYLAELLILVIIGKRR